MDEVVVEVDEAAEVHSAAGTDSEEVEEEAAEVSVVEEAVEVSVGEDAGEVSAEEVEVTEDEDEVVGERNRKMYKFNKFLPKVFALNKTSQVLAGGAKINYNEKPR